jgi:hypothetical protein
MRPGQTGRHLPFQLAVEGMIDAFSGQALCYRSVPKGARCGRQQYCLFRLNYALFQPKKAKMNKISDIYLYGLIPNAALFVSLGGLALKDTLVRDIEHRIMAVVEDPEGRKLELYDKG